MHLIISKQLVEQISLSSLKKHKITEISNENLNYEKNIKVDLRNLDEKQLSYLEKEVKKIIKLKLNISGIHVVKRDLDFWINGRKNSDTRKAKKVTEFCILLKDYLSKIEGHRIFKNDPLRQVNFCFYVGRIQYHEKERHQYHTTDERVTMDLFYIEFGIKCSHRVTFWPDECKGMTCLEALRAKGFMVETKELKEYYISEIERFHKHYDKVGRQFLATGIGTDDLDGNEEKRWRNDITKYHIDDNGNPGKIVVDVFHEEDKENRREKDEYIPTNFWLSETNDDEDDEDNNDDIYNEKEIEIPIHPLIATFDLKKHLRMKVHISQMKLYKYDEKLGENLVLPEENRGLIDILLSNKVKFKDIIKGKSVGNIVLCAGLPGTGKTLTSEVYSEVVKKPLYTVQCSQLGINPEELENNVMKIFKRAQRWKCILLLDEADVYVHKRMNDLHQNAIVGVFLRTLEYYQGIMFLTTNRADLIDDAILSRCIAKIEYKIPLIEDQKKIWAILSKSSNIEMSNKTIDNIVEKFPNLSGRDIKNLLKLALMYQEGSGKKITSKVIEYVKRFKPTEDLTQVKI